MKLDGTEVIASKSEVRRFWSHTTNSYRGHHVILSGLQVQAVRLVVRDEINRMLQAIDEDERQAIRDGFDPFNGI